MFLIVFFRGMLRLVGERVVIRISFFVENLFFRFVSFISNYSRGFS